MSVVLSITVSDAEYRRIVAVADVKQVPAHKIASGIVRQAVNPQPRTIPDHEPGKKLHSAHIGKIAELNRLGFNDLEIAERTGLNRETVRRHRVQMGLKRNGAHGRRLMNENTNRRAD